MHRIPLTLRVSNLELSRNIETKKNTWYLESEINGWKIWDTMIKEVLENFIGYHENKSDRRKREVKYMQKMWKLMAEQRVRLIAENYYCYKIQRIWIYEETWVSLSRNYFLLPIESGRGLLQIHQCLWRFESSLIFDAILFGFHCYTSVLRKKKLKNKKILHSIDLIVIKAVVNILKTCTWWQNSVKSTKGANIIITTTTKSTISVKN